MGVSTDRRGRGRVFQWDDGSMTSLGTLSGNRGRDLY